MKPFSKKNLKADLKEYSNEVTKRVNDYIISHPNIMHEVVEASKSFGNEEELYFWMKEQLWNNTPDIKRVYLDYEGPNKEMIQWKELAYAWFNTVKRAEPLPGSAIVDINKLPTLDKPKKIDELLEQLSIETDPTKKEKIKQHIERIKRGSLKQADELGEPMSPIQPAIDRGQKEVSKFDPEYEFLVRLVKLISKTSPEAIPEVKQLASSYPFKTVDDIGDLTAKIWTLATTKYNIPREWLISKLPEKKIKSSLNISEAIKQATSQCLISLKQEGIKNPTTWDVNNGLCEEWGKIVEKLVPGSEMIWLDTLGIDVPHLAIKYNDRYYDAEAPQGVNDPKQLSIVLNKKAALWPSQEAASEGTISQAPGQIAYNPTQEKDTSVSGPNPQDVVNEDALWDIVVNEFFTAHKRWSEVVKAIRLAHPEVTDSVILSLKDRVKKSLDNQMGMVGSSKKDIVNKCNTCKKEFKARSKNDLMCPKCQDEIYFKKTAKRKLNIDQVIKILDSKENKVDHIDFITNTIELIDGTKLTFDEATNQAMELDKTGLFQGSDFSHSDTITTAPESSPEDYGKKPQKLVWPNTNWLPMDDENKDEQPYSNIASSKKAFCKKEANPPSRFWIAPDGKEFSTGSSGHGAWIKLNKDVLKQYGVNISTVGYTWPDMIQKGWIRVSDEPAGIGFTIEVKNLANIPPYLDAFIAKYFSKGDRITIGMNDNFVQITDPFPSIQKAVNKALRNPINASKKQAAISGKIVRDILEIVESSGGITYNLSKGNLSGTDNYSVSIYPDREVINPGVVEFDDIQHYLDANEDLLSQPDNSLGIWSHNNQIYYDVVVTIPDKEQALKLARDNNQLAIWDLKQGQEISTGVVRAFSKKTFVKKAEESPLTEEQANQISSVSCPAYVIAVNNYWNAKRRGHSADRSLEYAIYSTKNLENIDEKKLVEFINNYLGPVK